MADGLICQDSLIGFTALTANCSSNSIALRRKCRRLLCLLLGGLDTLMQPKKSPRTNMIRGVAGQSPPGSPTRQAALEAAADAAMGRLSGPLKRRLSRSAVSMIAHESARFLTTESQ